jgi:hypothetical protein
MEKPVSNCNNLDDFLPGDYSNRAYQRTIFNDTSLAGVASKIKEADFLIVKYFMNVCQNDSIISIDGFALEQCIQVESSKVPGSWRKAVCSSNDCTIKAYDDVECKTENPHVLNITASTKEPACQSSPDSSIRYTVSRVQSINVPAALLAVKTFQRRYAIEEKTIYLEDSTCTEQYYRKIRKIIGSPKCPASRTYGTCMDKGKKIFSKQSCTNENDSFESLQHFHEILAIEPQGDREYIKVTKYLGLGCDPATKYYESITVLDERDEDYATPCIERSKFRQQIGRYVFDHYSDDQCKYRTRYGSWSVSSSELGSCKTLPGPSPVSFKVELAKEELNCQAVTVKLSSEGYTLN